jgi:MFS family permease
VGDPPVSHTVIKPRQRIFYGWYIVGASIVTNMLTTAAYFQGFQAFFLPILNTFGWSRTAISGAFSFRSLESGFIGPLIGMLADRIGPRRLIMIGAVIVGIGLIGLSQTRNLFMFYFFFVLTSVGTAGASHGISWSILLARWFRDLRGRAMGIGMSGPMLGGLFVIPNAALIVEFGWRPILFVYGFVVMLGIFLMGLVARNRPSDLGLRPDGTPHRDPSDGPNRQDYDSPEFEPGLRAVEILKTRDFWVLVTFLGSASIGSSAFGVHQLALFENLGFNSGSAATTVALVAFLSGIGRMGGGALIDFLDYRLVLVMLSACMSFAYFYLAIAPITSFATTLPFIVAFGIAFGAVIPLRPLLGSLLFGTRSMGTLIGMLQAGVVLEGAVGPLMMGYIFDKTNSYDFSLWILGVLPWLPIPLLLLMKPHSKLPFAGKMKTID